jgi:hypothetical protein
MYNYVFPLKNTFITVQLHFGTENTFVNIQLRFSYKKYCGECIITFRP